MRMWMVVAPFFFSIRRRHTRFKCDWSSDVCSSDLIISADGCAGTVKAFVAQGACDTDNGHPNCVLVNLQKILGVPGEVHTATEGILVRPEMLRQPLVNNNDARGSLVVAVIEASAANHGNPQGFEISGSHGDVQRRNQGFAGFHLIAFGENHTVIVIAAKGNGLGCAGEGN